MATRLQLTIAFLGLAAVLAGCTQQTASRPGASSLPQSSDKQIKIGPFDLPSPTSTATLTATPSPTPTVTQTPTATPTSTPTASPTATPTSTPMLSPSPSPTQILPSPSLSPSPTPTRPPYCQEGELVSGGCLCRFWTVTCEHYRCTNVVNGPFAWPIYTCDSVDLRCPIPGSYEFCRRHDPQYWCGFDELMPGGTGTRCLGKPVIYLYPEVAQLVSVEVQSTGQITVSDPTYKADGWQDVLAMPNGTLFYRGSQYRELYYETAVQKVTQPRFGTTVPIAKLESTLTWLTWELGLKADEQNEFLTYWLPRLRALKSPYIFISLLDQTEKQKLDAISVTPRPDTLIDFIVYFKPVDGILPKLPLVLPEKPKRRGFTVVEWGGVIDADISKNN